MANDILFAVLLLILAAAPGKARSDSNQKTDERGQETAPGRPYPMFAPESPPPPAPQQPPEREPEAEEPAPAKPARPSGPMSPGAARINMPTVIGTYVARHSRGGVWTVKDKAGKVWKLRLQKVLEGTTRKAGGRRYAACALLRTDRAPVHRLDMDFTVDFSETAWTVAAFRVHKVDGKPRKSPAPSGKTRRQALNAKRRREASDSPAH